MKIAMLFVCCTCALSCSVGNHPKMNTGHDGIAQSDRFADGEYLYVLDEYPEDGAIQFDVIITWCGQDDLFTDDYDQIKFFWNSSYFGVGDDGIAELLRRTELLPRGSVIGMRCLDKENQPTYPAYPVYNDETSIYNIADRNGLIIIMIPDIKQ